MKKFIVSLTLFVLALASQPTQAQTYTSTGNGNWMNPTIWSPMGIPVLGVNASTVIINSNVTLDTSYVISSGSLTVNAGKTLSEASSHRHLWINGNNTVVTNNGTLSVSVIYLQNGSITNNGVMNGVDSLLNQDVLTNGTNGQLTALQLENDMLFVNNGSCNVQNHLNTDSLVNNGTLTFAYFSNTGSYTGSGSVTTTDFLNCGRYRNLTGGALHCTNDFLNGNPYLHTAVFINDGSVVADHNWQNNDTVKGSSAGSFSVQDSSHNAGWMTGNFDFCDLTPPPVPPYIDLNTGSIAAGITWCTHTSVEVNSAESVMSIYPNPAHSRFTVETNFTSDCRLNVYSSTGVCVINQTLKSEHVEIFLSDLQAGIYIVVLQSGQGVNMQKLVVE